MVIKCKYCKGIGNQYKNIGHTSNCNYDKHNKIIKTVLEGMIDQYGYEKVEVCFDEVKTKHYSRLI